MNKTELINAVAEQAALSKKDSEAAVNAALEVITAALKDGDKLADVAKKYDLKDSSIADHTTNVGTSGIYSARVGRNPRTKEAIDIPASKVPVFKPGKALKDVIAQS